METICQPLDFYGCNIYSSTKVRAGESGRIEVVQAAQGGAHTHFGWNVAPEALYWGPKFLAERYKLPIVVTENGLSLNDWVGIDGRVRDHARIDFLNRYLRQLDRAVADALTSGGTFIGRSSTISNGRKGYKHRFGLVYVDYATQQRVPKESAYWFQRVMETNGDSLYTEWTGERAEYSEDVSELQSVPL